MSIAVRHITEQFGAQKALDDVSFEIGERVVGFLGPNGAGKSTMMKILTCFPAAYLRRCQRVRLRHPQRPAWTCGATSGYLPEQPLYTDLYVREYSEFTAGMYKMKNISKRVQEMVGTVGLEREQHKKIGALSKGYRQRVGLAQAMIHDPKVRILDEPTSGLDPNQLEEIRGLIKHIGEERTVMLSTHIMQEVEAICSRVIIIDRGHIVADDSAKHIRRLGDQQQAVLVEFDGRVTSEELLALPGVENALRGDGHTWTLTFREENDVRPAVFQFAVDKGLKVLTLQRAERDLESVFKELTASSVST